MIDKELIRLNNKENSIKNNIFKKSRLFRFSIYLMVILNALYVSIALYKAKISAPLLGRTDITFEEYSKVSSVTNYTSLLEVIFIALSISVVVLLFTKKHKQFQKSFLVIQLLVIIGLFLINELLAWLFNAPAGNMSQHLIYPFIILFAVSVYLLIKNIYITAVRKPIS